MTPEYQWITGLPSLCLIAITGMLIHFFKKQIKGETITEISQYFVSHFKSTVIAFVVTIVSTVSYFLTLSTGSPADVLTVFGLGYMCDSAFNKWDTAQ